MPNELVDGLICLLVKETVNPEILTNLRVFIAFKPRCTVVL